MQLSNDPRVKALHRHMMELMPEPVQAEYYLRHLAQVLAHSSSFSEKKSTIDLHDPSLRYFARMEPRALDRWLIDIDALEGDAQLRHHARGVGVAVLEMNGGVGSSMGIDPQLNRSKADGIMFRPRGPQGEDIFGVDLSVMTAKLLRHAWLGEAFRAVHVIPWNSTLTERGWRTFLAGPSALAPGMTNADYFAAKGIALHDSVVQQAFPLLHPDVTPVVSDIFERTVAPGGHGQILYHLYFSGILRQLVAQGVEVLVLVNSDCLNAAPSPAIAAAMVRDHIMAGLVSTDRSPLDVKGGIFAIFGAELGIIERASVIETQKKDFEKIGLAPRDNPQPFNTNSVYFNCTMVLAYLEEVKRERGSEAVHELLMPATIVNRKTFTHTVGGALREEKALMHLEGAIATVVLKLPGVRLFNATAAHRTSQFTPLKVTADVVYYLGSDAFYYDGEHHRLVQQRSSATQAEIVLEGWAGWNDLASTRAAFGRPSFARLTSLRVDGQVRVVDAVFEGNVAVVNETGAVLDCAALPELCDAGGRVYLHDVIVHAPATGRLRVLPFTSQNAKLFKRAPR